MAREKLSLPLPHQSVADASKYPPLLSMSQMVRMAWAVVYSGLIHSSYI